MMIQQNRRAKMRIRLNGKIDFDFGFIASPHLFSPPSLSLSIPKTINDVDGRERSVGTKKKKFYFLHSLLVPILSLSLYYFVVLDFFCFWTKAHSFVINICSDSSIFFSV
ncbi:hypothetical protein NH340_JMT06196 [Sarcoptes scabiei]|nr:hypothetical protein NH340_JMT06196 [Sarcoptes scabiei]